MTKILESGSGKDTALVGSHCDGIDHSFKVRRHFIHFIHSVNVEIANGS